MDWFLYDNGLRHERVNKNIYFEEHLRTTAFNDRDIKLRHWNQMLQKIFDATNTTKFHGKFESRVNKVSGLRVTRLLKRDSNNCF